MAMSQSVLMPIYANQILGGEERTLGLLLGSAGLGALLGAVSGQSTVDKAVRQNTMTPLASSKKRRIPVFGAVASKFKPF
jgi:hypothetical protein